jgi:Na+/H+ antiporter NhaA
MGMALLLRRLRVRWWTLYLLLAGVPCWFGLILASLHPSLALVFVVPIMPDDLRPKAADNAELPDGAAHASPTPSPPPSPPLSPPPSPPQLRSPQSRSPHLRSPPRRLPPLRSPPLRSPPLRSPPLRSPPLRSPPPSPPGAPLDAVPEGLEEGMLMEGEEEEVHVHVHDVSAPLHAFEHALKLPIDFGMFFFTLANAGVKVDLVGPLTLAVFVALVAGKAVGIVGCVLALDRCQLAPLGAGISKADVGMISATASIGLTVALFISGEAFQQETLKAEAKMGALLSGLMGMVCCGFAQSRLWKHHRTALGPLGPPAAAELGTTPERKMSVAMLHRERTSNRRSSLEYQQWRENVMAAHRPPADVDDVDNVAYIVAASLERQMIAATRQAVLMRERKAILTGSRASVLRASQLTPGSGRFSGAPSGARISGGPSSSAPRTSGRKREANAPDASPAAANTPATANAGGGRWWNSQLVPPGGEGGGGLFA